MLGEEPPTLASKLTDFFFTLGSALKVVGHQIEKLWSGIYKLFKIINYLGTIGTLDIIWYMIPGTSDYLSIILDYETPGGDFDLWNLN